MNIQRGPRNGAAVGTSTGRGLESSSLAGCTLWTTILKRKCSNVLLILIAFLLLVEIFVINRLDLVKSVGIGDTWNGSFYIPSSNRWFISIGEGELETHSCEEWLEKEDAVIYTRDFEKDPILVVGGEKEWRKCSVGCQFGHNVNEKKPDGVFGPSHSNGVPGILRSMESAHYYPSNGITQARRNGHHTVMTTSLSSDVPVGYFSWAEYDIMAPPLTSKNETSIAAAFISNCAARNFRLQAIEALENANIKIDSYGACHRNRDGNVNKIDTLKLYRFSLAFENSNEEDYVTEKFFQSLVAGSVPIVIGAPNVADFAPCPSSFLHIRELADVNQVAAQMKYLSQNTTAYNHFLRWKWEGPSDSFKALVDMAAVHSSCRLCIHLATIIRRRDDSKASSTRPCNCTIRSSLVVYHVYVRERGRLDFLSVFLRSDDLTLAAMEHVVLHKFRKVRNIPIWMEERPPSLRGGSNYQLRVYKIYPLGLTQRQALYTFQFANDTHFHHHIKHHPCPYFEVIFV